MLSAMSSYTLRSPSREEVVERRNDETRSRELVTLTVRPSRVELAQCMTSRAGGYLNSHHPRDMPTVCVVFTWQTRFCRVVC
jgi:hypothetical protein